MPAHAGGGTGMQPAQQRKCAGAYGGAAVARICLRKRVLESRARSISEFDGTTVNAKVLRTVVFFGVTIRRVHMSAFAMPCYDEQNELLNSVTTSSYPRGEQAVHVPEAPREPVMSEMSDIRQQAEPTKKWNPVNELEPVRGRSETASCWSPERRTRALLTSVLFGLAETECSCSRTAAACSCSSQDKACSRRRSRVP